MWIAVIALLLGSNLGTQSTAIFFVSRDSAFDTALNNSEKVVWNAFKAVTQQYF
jgi:hypothetical protein